MDYSANSNYKSLIEQDLMLPDNMAIQNNISMTDFNISKEDWNRIKNVPKYVDKLNFLFVIGISISFILLAIGLAILIKNGTLYGVFLTMFSLFMLGILIYGIFALRWYQIKTEEISEKQNQSGLEELEKCTEYALMSVLYIFLMLFFIICLFLTILCFAFQATYLNPIKIAAMNQNSWRKYYGDLKYNDVYRDSLDLLNIGGSTALVLSLFTLSGLFISFRMIGAYKSWQNINEFVCSGILTLGFLMIYYGVYCLKYSGLINSNKSMPKSYPEALIIAGCASVLISVLGIIGSFLEKKKLVKVFAILSIILSIFLLSVFISSILIGINFSQNYKCKDFLQYVSEDYAIETFGCDQKYSYVSRNSENMTCPKDRLVDAWDTSSGIIPITASSPYGCLDSVCCSVIENSTQKNLSLISVFSFFMFSLTVIISAGSFYVNQQSPHKTQFGISNKLVKWILLAVASVIALVILILISLIHEIKFSSVYNQVNLLQIQEPTYKSVEHIGNILKQHSKSFLKNLKGNTAKN